MTATKARGAIEYEAWRHAVDDAREAYYAIPARGSHEEREQAWAAYMAAADREDAATSALTAAMTNQGKAA